jgi:hypothetical protein
MPPGAAAVGAALLRQGLGYQRSPAVQAGNESLGVGIWTGRQLHKSVSARQSAEVTRIVGRLRYSPRPPPIIELDPDRHIKGQGDVDGHGPAQGYLFRRCRRGLSEAGEQCRDDVPMQANECRDGIAGKSKDRRAGTGDPEPQRLPRALSYLWKTGRTPSSSRALGTRSNFPMETPPLRTSTSWVSR